MAPGAINDIEQDESVRQPIRVILELNSCGAEIAHLPSQPWRQAWLAVIDELKTREAGPGAASQQQVRANLQGSLSLQAEGGRLDRGNQTALEHQ